MIRALNFRLISFFVLINSLALANDAELIRGTDPSNKITIPADENNSDLLFPALREGLPRWTGGSFALDPKSAPPAATAGFERDMDCLRPLRAAEHAGARKYYTPGAPHHKTKKENMSISELAQTLREEDRAKICATPIQLTPAMVAEKPFQITINLDTCRMDARLYGQNVPFEAVDGVPGAINYGDGSKKDKDSGKPAKTVTGCYQPTWFDDSHLSNRYNNAPMGKSLFFVGGQAIHVGSVRDPSHGCIHATSSDMNLIFKTIFTGDAKREIRPVHLEGTSVCVVGSGSWDTHRSCNAVRSGQRKSQPRRRS